MSKNFQLPIILIQTLLDIPTYSISKEQIFDATLQDELVIIKIVLQ